MQLNKLGWDIMVQHCRQSHYAGSKGALVIFYCHRKISWRNELQSWGMVSRSIEWGREHPKRKPSTKAWRRVHIFLSMFHILECFPDYRREYWSHTAALPWFYIQIYFETFSLVSWCHDFFCNCLSLWLPSTFSLFWDRCWQAESSEWLLRKTLCWDSTWFRNGPQRTLC